MAGLSRVEYASRDHLPEISLRTNYRWARVVSSGTPKIVDVTPLAVARGDWDGPLHQAARTAGLRLQHDELSVMRDGLARQITRYDPTRAKIWRFATRAAFWTLRNVRSKWSQAGVHIPVHAVHAGVRTYGTSLDAVRERTTHTDETSGGSSRNDYNILQRVEDSLDSVAFHRTPEDAEMDRLIQKGITKALRFLKPKEKKVFLRRAQWEFGLDRKNRPDPRPTWSDVARDEFGVTGEALNHHLRISHTKLRYHLKHVWAEYTR